MNNHRLEQCQSQVITTSPIILEVTVVEIWKQDVGVGITQSFNASITTIGVETIVVPNINVTEGEY